LRAAMFTAGIPCPKGLVHPRHLLHAPPLAVFASLALTDTNNLYGAVPLWKRPSANGIGRLLGRACDQKQVHCVALIRRASRVGEPMPYPHKTASANDPPSPAGTPRGEGTGVWELPELLTDNAAGLHVPRGRPDAGGTPDRGVRPRLWLEIVRPGPGTAPGLSTPSASATCWKGAGVWACGRLPAAPPTCHPEDYPTFRLATSVRQGGLIDQLPARAVHHA